jgi:hypothetical protein
MKSVTIGKFVHSHSTEWWAQSQASRSRLSTIAGLAYPVIPPRITKQRVRDQLACLASATVVRRIARLGGGSLLRHGVRARPFDLAAAGRLREPLRVRAPALARWAGTHRRCPPPFRLCRCRPAPPRVPQDRGDGAAHGERQGQEPPAAEEGMFRCSISIWGSGPGP